MTFSDLLPALDELDHKDKFRVVQYLISGLASSDDNYQNTDMDSAVEEALEFYRSELRSILEPEHDGENVAIHVASRSYEVAKGPGQAERALSAKHPDGVIVVHKIGPPNFGLISRMRGERP